MSQRLLIAALLSLTACSQYAISQDSPSLEDQLRRIDSEFLAEQVRLRGEPRRGALLFHMSAAGCVKCHASEAGRNPLGPSVASVDPKVSDEYLLDALLRPSKAIRKGYETTSIVTSDGRVVTGLVAEETDDELVLRDAADLTRETRIGLEAIDERVASSKSMMPDGLVNSLRSLPEFLDLASYVFEVARGGKSRAAELQPSPAELVVQDDTQDLNHAAIIRLTSKPRELRAGERIYFGLCVNCHGRDGNTPSLPTARAFGQQKLKFGADPYSMFLTLSRGNGLMAATTHLSPRERYQVIQFIRDEFMEDRNPGYEPVKDDYLASLPKGSKMGEAELDGERDYGPALASQLGREVTSVLTVALGDTTISYDLHTLDLAGVWTGGFLNLDATQHQRGRGEGYAQPGGEMIDALASWRWGHDGSLDYPTDDLLPRGPLPKEWLDYHGHYLHGDQIALTYAIDGREIIDVPAAVEETVGIRRTLRIGPGRELVVAVAAGDLAKSSTYGIYAKWDGPRTPKGAAEQTTAFSRNEKGSVVAARVFGDTNGLTWTINDEQQIVLTIPADAGERVVEVATVADQGLSARTALDSLVPSGQDPTELLGGGDLRWPDVIETTGYVGLETGAYAVDTITIPESTPWNTWFRTSTLGFFPDGRMAVATHGGDVWIVDGVDEDLLSLKWKRFAAGLYEPFGMLVVDDTIYVTCKDRITRLHDLNDDGEADFYESFHSDTDVSSFFHAFNFGLERDQEGNFYYAKAGQYTDHALPGAIIKLSPDGNQKDVYCTGFRTPNGIGMFPDGRLTVSDNQGNWMPASKISLVREGGFYGYVQTHATGRWAPDGGRIDHKKVVPPDDFDHPMIWMPQHVDNSSGGQIWIDDERWGPLSGRMLHTSFGKGWMFYLMPQEVRGQTQAALVRLPHDFVTGIMRGRVNPADGQVYVTGLDGWNGGGRRGLRDKGIQRVRYNGKLHRMVSNAEVTSNGLRLDFNFEVDSKTAEDPEAYSIEQWDYRWRASYGSDMFHPRTGERGIEEVEIEEAIVSADGRSVELIINDTIPVDQLHLEFDIEDADGQPFEEEIYWTINAVP